MPPMRDNHVDSGQKCNKKVLTKTIECYNICATMQNDSSSTKPSDSDTYSKVYRIQATGADGETVRVSVPREVVEKEARRLSVSIKDFVKLYRIQWLFNGFEGAWARFIPINKDDHQPKEELPSSPVVEIIEEKREE